MFETTDKTYIPNDATKHSELSTEHETLTLLKELVAIPSPYFEEDDIMQFVYDWFAKQAIPVSVHHYKERLYHQTPVVEYHGKNVIVTLQGTQPGPTLCLSGHLDTVQPSQGWTKDSRGEQDGNRFYGLGALDMKSGCAANMIALKKFASEIKHFKGKIIATFVSDEEGPFGMGTNALIEDGMLNDIDYAIVTEPSAAFNDVDFPDICLGARGGYGVIVEFYGKASHAANPHMGINAATDAAHFIQALHHIDYVKDDKLGTGTACVVSVSADGGACSVPDFATVRLNWHIVRGETPETIENIIHQTIKNAGIKSRYAIKYRQAPSQGAKGYLPYAITGDDELTQSFIKVTQQVTNKPPSLSYFSSVGDFNYLATRLGNVPTIICGASGKNYHSPDEYVEIDSVIQLTEVIYQFLKESLALS